MCYSFSGGGRLSLLPFGCGSFIGLLDTLYVKPNSVVKRHIKAPRSREAFLTTGAERVEYVSVPFHSLGTRRLPVTPRFNMSFYHGNIYSYSLTHIHNKILHGEPNTYS